MLIGLTSSPNSGMRSLASDVQICTVRSVEFVIGVLFSKGRILRVGIGILVLMLVLGMWRGGGRLWLILRRGRL
jgi:hypothetical protein